MTDSKGRSRRLTMDPNALNGAQVEILQEAILSAFAKPELDQLFSHGDRDEIDDSVAPGPFETQVLEIIKLSQREGWTDWLISSIVEERPRNSRISKLLAELERAAAHPAPTLKNAQEPVIPSPSTRSVTVDANLNRGTSATSKAGYLLVAVGVAALAGFAIVKLGNFDLGKWLSSPDAKSALLACDSEEPRTALLDIKPLDFIGIFVKTEGQLPYANKLRDDVIKLGFDNVTVEGPDPNFDGFPERDVETRYFSTTNADNACRVSVLASQLGPYQSVTMPHLEPENASATGQVEVWFPDK